MQRKYIAFNSCFRIFYVFWDSRTNYLQIICKLLYPSYELSVYLSNIKDFICYINTCLSNVCVRDMFEDENFSFERFANGLQTVRVLCGLMMYT